MPCSSVRLRLFAPFSDPRNSTFVFHHNPADLSLTCHCRLASDKGRSFLACCPPSLLLPLSLSYFISVFRISCLPQDFYQATYYSTYRNLFSFLPQNRCWIMPRGTK